MTTIRRGAALEQIGRLFGAGTLAGLTDAQLVRRFAADGDELAFAALVDRHGRSVLATCRAVLRDGHAAEDAFQATFLALARKAASLRVGDSIAGWLHRVAHRSALRANAEAARRRVVEARAGVAATAADDPRGPAQDELRSVVREELAQLPERYRLPLVLCELEGLSRAGAACRLGWTEGSVRGRLERGRALLRSRLVRRGVAPAAAISGLRGLAGASPAAVPKGLAAATARLATAAASGASSAGQISPVVAGLATGVLRSIARAKLAGLGLASIAALATAAALGPLGTGPGPRAATAPMPIPTASPPRPSPDPGPAPPAPDAGTPSPIPPPRPDPAPGQEPDADEPGPPITVRGRVLGPDGEPFEGATIHLVSYVLADRLGAAARATTAADGRFRFDVPRADFDASHSEEPWRNLTVLARAPGLGLGIAWTGEGDAELTPLRLPPVDPPLEGRVVDLEGRPVPGVAVTLRDIAASVEGDLSAWLDALRESGEAYGSAQGLLPIRWHAASDDLFPTTTTDADGRFRIPGVGRERVADLLVSGPSIEAAVIHAMTRPGETIRVPEYAGSRSPDLVTIYGTGFEHVAGPSRPIEGVVRDLDTGEPLAGILVIGERSLGNPITHIESITDADGRYRLIGLPRGREGHLLALPPSDAPYGGPRKAAMGLTPDEALPYLRARVAVGDEGGLEPVTLDVGLKRGVWITGRTLDAQSGAPVPAHVEYFVFIDNPHLEAYPAYRWAMTHGQWTGRDGTFALAAFPGPGLLAARGNEDRYAFAFGVGAEGIEGREEGGFFRTHPSIPYEGNYHTLAAITPAEGDESATIDLRLDPGRTLPGTVLDPDGAPLAGARIAGQKDMGYWEGPLEGAEFEAVGLLPGKGRTLTVRHDERELIGTLTLEGDEEGPLSVRLGPWGSARGRLVDAASEPIGGVELIGINIPSGRVPVDREGRFRVEGLVPGEVYRPYVLQDGYLQIGRLGGEFSVDPGEEKDLGDVTLTRDEP